jgi:hypothetical protein
MPIDLSSKTFGVFDHHSLFLPVALRLAESGARVLYQTPTDRRDSINEAIVGDGFPEIECCDDLWLVKKEVDCFVFPDVRHMGMQLELRSQGFPVWGAGRGMRLELDREFFLKKLAELGLDVPDYTVRVGLTELRNFLKSREDIYIKVSKWRGSWETFHWRTNAEDAHHFDMWGMRFGGLKEMIRFICFPAIDTNLEIGADTYCIDGKWPNTMLHGIERKDEAYFAAVTDREKMPEELMPIMEAFSPFLKKVNYRCQWSMEARVTDTETFFIDATTRGGLPSTASLLMAKNFPEIIYQGAKGDLVEPDYGFKFSAECMVKIKSEPGAWGTIVLPAELKAHLKLCDCCEVDGQPWFPADEGPIEEIGWMVATGDTPTEVAKEMNRLADLLPDGADASVEALADVIREIEEEQEQGIKFTDQPMPQAEIVLEST